MKARVVYLSFCDPRGEETQAEGETKELIPRRKEMASDPRSGLLD